MKEYKVPYGRTSISFKLPEDWQVMELTPRSAAGLENPLKAVEESLADTVGIFASHSGRKTVAVAINDKTRPVPHSVLLPPLLAWLEAIGYRREDITLIIASGAHAPMPQQEFKLIVPPEIENAYRIISHDAENSETLKYLGKTSSGTRCVINQDFAEADLKIVVGNIEPHQFMGWSGGVKSAAIGLGSTACISANHSLLSREGAGPCRFDDNPVRQDVEEMGGLIAVDMALNVVMNSSKEIVGVFAGDPQTVMKRGIELAFNIFAAEIEAPADLVISSAGGHPKDINLYQTQKALRHGSAAAARHAPMILVGACPEGIGSASYEKWTRGKKSHKEVRESFEREEFRVGPHKAMLFAADAEDRDVYLVSEIPDETVNEMLLIPADTIQEIIDTFARTRQAKGLSAAARVAILPYGNSTVPVHSKG